MRICISTGTGEGPTPLAAFDAALLDAGVANYNLIFLSSVIPPGAVVERSRFVAPADEYGRRLYVVAARAQEQTPGRMAWAGLGWTMDANDYKGLFVEIEGSSRDEVQLKIEATLADMTAHRPDITFGPIQVEIAGIECHDRPVCALVIATYESVPWSEGGRKDIPR